MWIRRVSSTADREARVGQEGGAGCRYSWRCLEQGEYVGQELGWRVRLEQAAEVFLRDSKTLDLYPVV